MAVKIEREEVGLSEIPEKEQRFLEHPSYSRNGLIPAWSEVVGKFKLKDLHPRDFRLVRGYYRAQQRLAEGKRKKAGRIFKALEKNTDFQALEKRDGSLLTNISNFVRGPTERKRQLDNR